MKLTRLASTTQRPSQESMARVREHEDERVRRVETLEGIEGDRQRSLQQEMAEIEPGALAPFKGEGQILNEARAVAAQLSELSDPLGKLIKPGALRGRPVGVDDSA